MLRYAGVDGPIASIRLHNVRDGIEDHGYLALLRKKSGNAAVQALVAKVSQPGDLTQHASGSAADLQLMMDLRDAVAAQLEG